MSTEIPGGSVSGHLVRSSVWLYGRRTATSLLNMGVTVLLARKLLSSDFGVIALANVLMQFMMNITSIGVADYIIADRKEGREERVHAAFWLNGAMTLVAVAVCGLLIPVVGHFYDMPELKLVLALMLVQFAVSQLASVVDALLRRELDFKTVAIRETGLEVANGLGMLGMALSGMGVWSLVVPGAILSPVRFILAMKYARWKPELPLRRHMWPGIFRYSAHATGAGLVTLVGAEGDTLLVGKVLGPAALGLYNQAWSSANLISRNITGVIGKLAMPALSKFADDLPRLRQALNRMLRLLGMLSFPMLVGLFVVADLFIVTLYGPQWVEAVLPLRILILFAMRQSVGSPSAVIYNVIGRPDIGFKMGLSFLPLYGASIWIGSYYGIVGVAVGVTAARTIQGMVQFHVVAKLVGQTMGQMLSGLVEPLGASLLLGGIVALGRWVIGHWSMPVPLLLISLSAFGGLVWLFLLAKVFPKMGDEMISLVEPLSPKFAAIIRRSVLVFR